MSAVEKKKTQSSVRGIRSAKERAGRFFNQGEPCLCFMCIATSLTHSTSISGVPTMHHGPEVWR